ncbi:Alpha and gamma adaptin binding protein p34 [Geosmithia morbida]|uniref:Alpha and gamma adaptin binding protein p34 n=1 Tax=Geosmithia morbida TaxID=1094350 RepID=A0A9P4YRX5_9HYPO|nr:Alpha and gamma adaptin binding protein p34 [Geosmithia morbida]KAF4120669.1 Alpha and gamma adaptin binding protein p34 [Geosmithia morbida]
MADIPNPRRILAVGLDTTTDYLTRVLRDLTGSVPEQTSTTLAGTTHDLPLSTAYYTTTVPIWIDLISSPKEWAESFLSSEAKEVLSVLGGLVVVFPLPAASGPDGQEDQEGEEEGDDDGQQQQQERKKQERPSHAQIKDLITHLGKIIRDGLGGWSWDGVSLAVGVGGSSDLAEQWDDLCGEAGLEFVHVTGDSRAGGCNEFGEKTGIPRVREALEANDWVQIDDLDAALSDEFGEFDHNDKDKDDEDEDVDAELDPSKLEFGFDRSDFDGLREAIWTSGVAQKEDDDVQGEEEKTGGPTDGASTGRAEPTDKLDDDDIIKVESMMRRLQAVREAGEGMSEAQRRRMAARAVGQVMKEL